MPPVVPLHEEALVDTKSVIDVADTVMNILLQNIRVPTIEYANPTMHYDAQLAAFREILHALGTAVHTHFSSLSRKRNLTVAINRLPTEVFHEIMSYVVDGLESYAPVVALMRVCRQWHDFVQHTPTFWSHLSGEYPSAATSTLLSRSKQAPLQIHCQRPKKEKSFMWRWIHGDELELPFDPEVCLHINRWETVDLDLEHLRGFHFDAPAPMIRKFKLHLHHGPAAPIDLFHGHAPLLQELSMSGWTMPWSSPLLAGLTTLRLRNIKPNGPTVHDLVRILNACPLLSYFELSDCNIPAPDSGPQPLFEKPTPLPLLKTWVTTDIDVPSMDLLLKSIEFPNACDVSVGLSDNQNWPGRLAPESPLRRLFDWLLRQDSDLFVEDRHARFVVGARIGQKVLPSRLIINVSWDQEQLFLSRMTELYGSSFTHRVTSLAVTEGIRNAQRPQEVVETLANMPRLQDLQLTGYDAVDCILEYLTRLSFDNGLGSWSLPQLRSLGLYHCKWSISNGLLDVVSWRNGVSLRNVSGLEVVLPQRICSLNVEGRRLPVAERLAIANMMDPGNFTYPEDVEDSGDEEQEGSDQADEDSVFD